MLIGTYPPPYGGVSIHIEYLSEFLTRESYQVCVLSRRPTPGIETHNGVTIYRYLASEGTLKNALRRARLHWPQWRELREPLSALGLDAEDILDVTRLYEMLRSVVRQEGSVHLISAYHLLPMGLAACLTKQELGVPVIVTNFGEIYERPDYFAQRKAAVAFVLEQADVRLSVSQHCARGVAQLGFDPSRIQVIPYGIDTSRYTPDVDGLRVRQQLGITGEQRIILFVGRFAENTGVDTVLDMIPHLTKGNANIRFILAGGRGNRAAAVTDFAKKYAGRVDVVIDVPSDELPYYYAASDVVVAPTTDDRACMGMTLKEGMASARPIVAANVGGVSEAIVHGQVGMLVPPNDGMALAEAVAYLLDHPAEAASMGFHARQRAVELFEERVTCQRIKQVIGQVIK